MEDFAESAGTHQDQQYIEIPSLSCIVTTLCCQLNCSANLRPLPCPRYQPPEMSYCKAIGLFLCLQLLSYCVTAQNANASASAISGNTPSPAAGGSSTATAIATSLSSGNAQAAANAIAAAQSAGQSSAYAAAFAQVSSTHQHVWQTERCSFGCLCVYMFCGIVGQVVWRFSIGSRTSTGFY